HVSVDLRSGSDPAAVRAILDDEIARATAARDPGEDQRQIDRVITRREAGVIWSLGSVSKRAAAIQRYMLYTEEPDGFAADLARYRAVTPATLAHATARWLAAPFIEIETVPGAATARASAS
ncbi:MAG: hypothetical protein H0T79_13975, partial [Deltaproteobacteria bacterium]|nr:hypothetical protein [Deltaproteobacteria bacterium]